MSRVQTPAARPYDAVVGFRDDLVDVAERNRRHDRPEDLLLHDLHFSLVLTSTVGFTK